MKNDKKALILYNYNVKLFLREQAGSEVFKKIDKRILGVFEDSMKVDIFDEKEKEVKETPPAEFKLPEEKKKVEATAKKQDKQEDVVSLQIHLPRRGDTKAKSYDDDDVGSKPSGGAKGGKK